MAQRLREDVLFTTLFFLLILLSPGLFAQGYELQKTLSVKPISVIAPPELTDLLLNKAPAVIESQGAPGLPAAPITIKSEDFEGAFPGEWDVFDNDGATNGEVYWAASDFRASGGTKSGWSAGGGADGVAGGADYPNNMQSWMLYGPFDLSDATLAAADFKVWLDSQTNIDLLSWMSSTDGSSFSGFQVGGSFTGWSPVQFDFSATGATGQASVWLAFIFSSDASVSGGGAYIDDVVISKQTDAPDFDLELQTIEVADEPYYPGDAISITTEVQNIGAATGPAWSISYYLSTDATITSGDTPLGGLSGLPALGAAESSLFPVNSFLPNPLADGDYFVGAIIDTTDANSANNTNYDTSAIAVSSSPDIRVRPVSISISGAPEPVASQSVSERSYERTPVRAKTDVLAELLPQADQQGQVSVIVGFDISFVPQGMLSTSAIQGQQAAISNAQEMLSASLQGMNFTEKARFQYIPFMALRVDSQALLALVNNPNVLSIEEDRVAKPLMNSSNPVIGSPIAWADNLDGTGQAVAILDTGVDTSHPSFNTGGSRVASEACYSSNNGSITDSLCPGGVSNSTAEGSGVNCVGLSGCDHGTHVAGTVAGNDGTGPGYGVAKDANIIAMQVFSKFLNDSDCGPGKAPCALTYSSDQLLALGRVLTLSNTMDIAAVNMSLGGNQFFSQAACDANNPALLAAIDSLAAVGIATVIASGNDGYTTSTGTPGCLSSAITVGATNDKDSVAGFSNIASFIDLLAPGVDIISSVPGGGTASKQGTSMATPHVAGAWAVIKEYAPAATVAEVLGALSSSGTVVDDLRNGGSVTGMRRINVEQALANLGYMTKSFGISNEGFNPLNITSITPSVESSWLSFNPPAPFSVEQGEMQVVEVVIDFNNTPVGVTERVIVVESNDPNESPYPGGINLSVDNAGVGPAPTVTKIDPSTTGPTNADNISFSVTFSEDVINFNNADDVIISHSGTGNTGVSISGSNSTYTVEVTGISGNGSFTLKADTDSDVEDASGQGLASSVTSDAVAIDNLPPGISIGLPDTTLTTTGPVNFPVTYTGASNVSLANEDVSLLKSGSANGTIAVTGSGTSTRMVSISNITGTGTLAISIAAGTATDSAGNIAPGTPSSDSFDADNTEPTVTAIIPGTTGPTAAGEVSFAITFSEPVMNFDDASDVIITHSGTVHSDVLISGSGDSYSANVTGLDGNGSFTLKVNTGSGIQDVPGNALVSSIESAPVMIDNEPPGISIGAPSVDSTQYGPVSFTISYIGASSIVPNFADFVSLITTGSVDAGTIEATGSGTEERVVTLSDITGSGTIAISIDASSAEDAAGNSAGAAGPSQIVLIELTQLIFGDSFESKEP